MFFAFKELLTCCDAILDYSLRLRSTEISYENVTNEAVISQDEYFLNPMHL